jgi:ribose-phosphate pyrophosphokinase
MRLWFCFVCVLGSIFAEMPSFKLFSGSGNPKLAKAVADSLGIPLGKVLIGKFNDGEIRIDIEENVRNSDIYLLQSVSISPNATVNDNLMELFLMVRAMKRASAKSVTAIIPYYGYGRQDRKMEGRSPISASDVAMMLELAGADQVMSIDLHCGQIQGFFHDIPLDNLFGAESFIPYIFNEKLHDPVIVSPDAGGVGRAKTFIEGLQSMGVSSKLAIIIKQRAEAGVVDTMNLVGNVAGSDVVIVDDICDTAGTLVKAADELKKQGAARVYACITHPLFSEPALDRIASSSIHKLVVSDTIPLRKEIPPNVQQLSIAPLLAEAIQRHSKGQSLKELALKNRCGRSGIVMGESRPGE